MGELNNQPMKINGVEGAVGQVKVSGGPGVLEIWEDPAGAVIESTIVSDVLHTSNDAEKTSTAAAYTKVKEILLGGDLPAVRCKFDAYKTTPCTAGFRVYKNGAAEGIEQVGGADVYATLSEDFAGWVAGDLIQVYVYNDGGLTMKVKNFRFYYDPIISQPTTNQDP